MKIALLGGSFDPPHMAHIMSCLVLLEAEDFERVWLLPCFEHAFRKRLASFQHRLAMCSLVAKPFGGRVIVSEVEENLSQQEGNRTVDTIDYLKAHFPDDEFTMVIGSDIIPELPAWKDYQGLKKKIPIFVLRRPGGDNHQPGWNYSQIVLPEISSTEIRLRLSKGMSVEGLVSVSVLEYLDKYNLYETG